MFGVCETLNVLIIHQNFPGQFKHLAPALVRSGHTVKALSLQIDKVIDWNGVEVMPYRTKRDTTIGIHPWISDFETKVIRAEACVRKAKEMCLKGFWPDLILAHHGWGEPMFLKEVWPNAKLAIYCEYYYLTTGGDVNFDPEFTTENRFLSDCRLKLKNLNNLYHFSILDAAISPTRWQASTFPDEVRDRITVIHDGIDTSSLIPRTDAQLSIETSKGTLVLTKDSNVITFVNRELEPLRGFHIFMRALPKILREKPESQIVIIGGDGVSYGAAPDVNKYGKKSWKQIFVDEIAESISDQEKARIHFLGRVPYELYKAALQISSCHVYFTYPFVLSWSLLEAMSIGCPIVASDTAPVHDAIEDGVSGLLGDFFDPEGLAVKCIKILNDTDLSKRLCSGARQRAVNQYDLRTKCLPEQLNWVQEITAR